MGHCTVFVCPATRGGLQADPEPSVEPQDRPRPGIVKWFISLFFCCWKRKRSRNTGDTDNSTKIEMGPMTLRDYINTLEPYDPQIHGWRGDEPRIKPHWFTNGVVTSTATTTTTTMTCYSARYHATEDGCLTIQRNKIV